MRKLLIVSPHFPPVNAPDIHRVRMSLLYFRDFGWEPRVLAVDPILAARTIDPALLQTIPPDVPVHRTKAFDPRWTRKFGISAIGLRALPFLYREGARMIQENRPDLIYFSTTAFPVLTLGRLWKRHFGVPFVVDLQDPWVGDYYEKRPRKERPPKYALAQLMHRILESFTMRDVSGIVAVSEAYHVALRKRYPWIKIDMCRTIPFGASEKDSEVAARMKWHNLFFAPGGGLLHGVYVGVLGRVMTEACRAICLAFRRGLDDQPALFSKIRLHFIGTDYATGERSRQTIRPLAAEYGLDQFVFEETNRVPYFDALRLLQDADFLVVPGSDNPSYTASKIYPYILSRKPLLAIFHEESSVVAVLRKTNAGEIVTFASGDRSNQIAERLFPALTTLLAGLPFAPKTDWSEVEQFSARETTRKQCELFEHVLAQDRQSRNHRSSRKLPESST